jgi:hypothetical protein
MPATSNLSVTFNDFLFADRAAIQRGQDHVAGVPRLNGRERLAGESGPSRARSGVRADPFDIDAPLKTHSRGRSVEPEG